MSKTIVTAITNFKGGTGKTTITHNLGATLESRGFNVLLIDFDSQKNLSKYCGYSNESKTVIDLLMKIMYAEDIDDYHIKNIYGNLDIIPCGFSKERWMQMIISEISRETILSKLIRQIENAFDYDFILIDNAPTIGTDCQNSLIASDNTLIVAEAEEGAVEGIIVTTRMIETLRRENYPCVRSLGIVLNGVDERTNLHKEMEDQIKKDFESTYGVFQTMIPKSITAPEAQKLKQPICKYKPDSKIQAAFEKLCDEYLERIIEQP